MRLLLLLLPLLPPLLDGVAVAQEPPARDGAAERFAAMDRNGDGRLSVAEWDAAVATRMAGRADVTAGAVAATRQMFGRIDADRDGFLSLDEVRAFGRALRADGRTT